MFSGKARQASEMYESGKIYVYQVTWVNTIIGCNMLRNILSYDKETAQNAAHDLMTEMNSRERYYPARASWEYIGIYDLHKLPSGDIEFAEPPFNFK